MTRWIPILFVLGLSGLVRPSMAYDSDQMVECGWWAELPQMARNERIALEAQRQYHHTIEGGYSKNFAKVILLRASDSAATLPSYTYNYGGWYREVPPQDVEPGHVVQILEPKRHTAIVVDVVGGGMVEVVDSNAHDQGRTRRHALTLDDTRQSYTIYEIGTGMCTLM